MRLFTSIERTDENGDPDEVEVVITFTVTRFNRGYASSLTDPGWSDEYEFHLEDAELHRQPASAAPLTDTEMAQIKNWFAAHHDDASEVAADQYHDGPDPDARRDSANDNARQFGVG